MTSSTTSWSVHAPVTTASSSFPSTPNSPAATIQQPRHTPNIYDQAPRRAASTKSNLAATSAHSATPNSAFDTPSKSNAMFGNSSPSSSASIRERRRLGQLNVGIIAPNRFVQTLPETRGKENESSPATPAASSTTSLSLKDRMMARFGQK